MNLAILPSCHLNGRNRKMYTTTASASMNSPAVTPAWFLVGGFMCSKIIMKGTVKYLHRNMALSVSSLCKHL